VLGATFLMLAYFGTDQSQVQRYISGASLRESRLGLMFNAVFKIPMQFFILSLGVLLFLFYQFEKTTGLFQRGRMETPAEHGDAGRLRPSKRTFAAAHDRERLQWKRGWPRGAPGMSLPNPPPARLYRSP